MIKEVQIKLRPKYQKKKKQHLFSDFLLKILKSNAWSIYNGNWVELDAKDAFQKIQSTTVQNLFINTNKHPKIIKDIERTYFSNLKRIWIYSNQIQSIQNIQKLNCPCLQTINLSFNLISNIQSLRKSNFKQLTLISLYGNSIKQMNQLSQLNCKNLRQIRFQQKQSRAQVNDFQNIIKVESKQCIYLDFKSNNRVQREQINQMLKKKYKDLIA